MRPGITFRVVSYIICSVKPTSDTGMGWTTRVANCDRRGPHQTPGVTAAAQAGPATL